MAPQNALNILPRASTGRLEQLPVLDAAVLEGGDAAPPILDEYSPCGSVESTSSNRCRIKVNPGHDYAFLRHPAAAARTRPSTSG